MNFLTKRYSEKVIQVHISKNIITPKEWSDISWYQVLSEEFIREYRKELHWGSISWYQVLSEEFIREFEDEVHWDIISRRQKLSNKFKYEMYDSVFIYWIKKSNNPKEVL